MGYAGKHLSPGQCESIARSLLTDMAPHPTGKVGYGARCPMHTEGTTSNYSFFYNPEDDCGHCHSCGNHIDLIGIFNLVNGRDEQDPDGFKEFCERYAPEILGKGGAPRQPAAPRKPVDWTPRQTPPAPETWVQRAERFVAKRAATLLDTPYALEQLARWGITPETARACRIGWVEEKRFYHYQNWGLEPVLKPDGRPRKIYAPVGLVFPCYSGGVLRRIKIRADNPGEGELRYRAMEGGDASYGIWGRADSPFWIVVETERDAILCWQELRRYGFGAMATGNASLAPDPHAHAILSRCECVVNALDNDHAGARASWGFATEMEKFRWSVAYPHSIRWLVPGVVGKDVGDLPGAGIDVWEWLRRGLPMWMVAACLRHAEKWDRRTEEQRGDAPPETTAPPEAPAAVLLEWPSPDVLAAIPAPDGCGPWTYQHILASAAEFGLRPEVRGTEIRLAYREGYARKSDEVEFLLDLMQGDPRIADMLRGAARAQEVLA
ncbi:hypothetical protein [Nitratidesulfovibrio sp. 1201_IL3209]|uniref:hypothetical protein n=1 Tax=Nitratidesulfovibrio sp. 1201_IL3209 TaxID=3084053 RepID=UPI002FD8CCD5